MTLVEYYRKYNELTNKANEKIKFIVRDIFNKGDSIHYKGKEYTVAGFCYPSIQSFKFPWVLLFDGDNKPLLAISAFSDDLDGQRITLKEYVERCGKVIDEFKRLVKAEEKKL